MLNQITCAVLAIVIFGICWSTVFRKSSRSSANIITSLREPGKAVQNKESKATSDSFLRDKQVRLKAEDSLHPPVVIKSPKGTLESAASSVASSKGDVLSHSAKAKDRELESFMPQMTPSDDSKLMPPPPPPAHALNSKTTTNASRPNTSQAATLRVPPNGLLSTISTSGGVSQAQTKLTATGNPVSSSRKVTLEPGYSALDWAALNSSSQPNPTLTGLPENLQPPLRIPLSQLKMANGRKGAPAWSSFHGKVYNIGAYRRYHPGGEKELMRAAGRDGEHLFREIHPWVNWESILSGCLVGYLVQERQ